MVVLVCAMREGLSASRASKLCALFGVSPRTLARWRAWWTETFPTTRFWRSARVWLRGEVDASRLPLSLVECFSASTEATLMTRVLAFLSPITTANCAMKASIPMLD